MPVMMERQPSSGAQRKLTPPVIRCGIPLRQVQLRIFYREKGAIANVGGFMGYSEYTS